jgi:hypothetical protein
MQHRRALQATHTDRPVTPVCALSPFKWIVTTLDQQKIKFGATLLFFLAVLPSS